MASSSSVMLLNEFDVAAVTFGKCRSLDSGGRNVFINSAAGGPIVLQLPELTTPFGLSKWDNDAGGPPKYSLDVSLRGWNEENPDRVAAKGKALYEKLAALDEKVIAAAAANSFDWLKKKNMSVDVVSELYTRSVRRGIDKATGEFNNYPPTMKLTVPFKDGRFGCEAYDVKGNLLDMASVNFKNARVTAIVQATGTWIAAGRFGVSWRVLQLRVKAGSSLRGAPAFRIEAGDEEDADGVVDSDEAVPPTDDLW
jgi:hypothetical protein